MGPREADYDLAAYRIKSQVIIEQGDTPLLRYCLEQLQTSHEFPALFINGLRTRRFAADRNDGPFGF